MKELLLLLLLYYHCFCYDYCYSSSTITITNCFTTLVIDVFKIQFTVQATKLLWTGLMKNPRYFWNFLDTLSFIERWTAFLKSQQDTYFQINFATSTINIHTATTKVKKNCFIQWDLMYLDKFFLSQLWFAVSVNRIHDNTVLTIA